MSNFEIAAVKKESVNKQSEDFCQLNKIYYSL